MQAVVVHRLVAAMRSLIPRLAGDPKDRAEEGPYECAAPAGVRETMGKQFAKWRSGTLGSASGVTNAFDCEPEDDRPTSAFPDVNSRPLGRRSKRRFGRKRSSRIFHSETDSESLDNCAHTCSRRSRTVLPSATDLEEHSTDMKVETSVTLTQRSSEPAHVCLRGRFPNPSSVTCYIGSFMQSIFHSLPIRAALLEHTNRQCPAASECFLCLLQSALLSTDDSKNTYLVLDEWMPATTRCLHYQKHWQMDPRDVLNGICGIEQAAHQMFMAVAGLQLQACGLISCQCGHEADRSFSKTEDHITFNMPLGTRDTTLAEVFSVTRNVDQREVTHAGGG